MTWETSHQSMDQSMDGTGWANVNPSYLREGIEFRGETLFPA